MPALNHFLIRINSGLLLRFYDVFLRLVNLKEFFPNLDGFSLSGLSDGKRQELATWSAGCVELLNPCCRHLSIAAPLPARAELALTLSYFALEFVTMHEMGHFQKGHLAYASHLGLAEYVELNYARSANDRRPLQHFELQADENALEFAGLAWGTLLSEHPFTHRPFTVCKFGYPFGSGADVYDVWLFSIATVFVVLGIWTGTTADIETASHPFPPYRYDVLIKRVSQIFPELTPSAGSLRGFDIIRSVVQLMQKVGYQMEALLDSMQKFEQQGWTEKLDARLGAAFRSDEPVLANLRMKTADLSKAPVYVSQFMRLWPKIVQQLNRVPGDVANPGETSEFQELMQSSEINELCRSAESLAMILKMKDAMKVRGVEDRRLDALIREIDLRSRR
jgi:hypothetical protein